MTTNIARSLGKNSRGATMIEAAITAPVFLLLIFGIMEAGFLMRNHLVVNSAATESVRLETVRGQARDADYNSLATLKHGLNGVDPDDIDVIVVYKANGAGDTSFDPGCLVASIPDVCNRYTAADLELPYKLPSGVRSDHWGCGPISLDQSWCPEDRLTALDDPPDYIGVYVQIRHQYLTGFIGSERELSANRVMRLEANKATE